MHCIGSDEEDSQDGLEAEQSTVMLGDIWEVIGPFPSGMREHPLMASPLHALTRRGKDADLQFAFGPYDKDQTWPSELSDGGRVGWSEFKTGTDGWVEVAYPHIRWEQLRADRGWASLQYQVLLRTTLSIPADSKSDTCLRIDAKQLTEYAIVQKNDEGPVKWYQGDMYDFAESPRAGHRTGSTSGFARSISLRPGQYTLIARAIYEIRLFGDPVDKPPTIRFKVVTEEDDLAIRVERGMEIVPDVVDGWFMGDYMSVAVHNPATSPPTTIQHARGTLDGVTVELERSVALQPGQTRMAIFAIRQQRSLPTDADAARIPIIFSLLNKDSETSEESCYQVSARYRASTRPFRITFPSPTIPVKGLPAQIGFAVAIPPKRPILNRDASSSEADVPVVLATHGAGVDAEWDEWVNAIPATGGWAVLPTGKNEWGEDWHGASMADAWAARDALPSVLNKLGKKVSDKTLLIGHSNGGQGAWHLAARYPDRIVGVIAAAGYLKIQDYVPYAELTGHHHADPALMGILMSSLSPYNNDLHLSNLVGIPCLALHGGSDGNVPPRHSRAYASIISAWQHDASAVEIVEVPVLAFIQRVLSTAKPDWDAERKMGFTLTAVTPEENGGRAGIRIVEVDTPGRMARLDVNAPHWRNGTPSNGIDLRGMNVKRIEMTSQGSTRTFSNRKSDGQFVVSGSSEGDAQYRPRTSGPVIRILSGTGPLHFVVGNNPRHRDLAIRLAHDTFVHHRLDSVILSAQEALEEVGREEIGGNLIVIGRPDENDFARWLFGQKRIPVSFPTRGILQVTDKVVYDQGSGIISLHPHPVNPTGLALVIAGNDDAGMETAARLFPIRTGVTVPDWVVGGARMAWQAAGGIVGAGFWDGQWGWSDSMSWFDR